MAQKYHINKHGVPAPCHAKEGNCPLGGETQHFNTQEEAQVYADKINEEKHGLLPSNNEDLQEEELDKFCDNAYEEVLEDYSHEKPSSMDMYERDEFEEEVNKYFRQVIKDHEKGIVTSADDYDYGFEESAMEDRDSFYSQSGGPGHIGAPNETWDSAAEERFSEHIAHAEKLGNHYYERKAFIDDMATEIRNTDWTDTFSSQEEGEREALEALYYSDVAIE